MFDTVFELIWLVLYAWYMFFLFGPRARRSKRDAARDIRLQGGERIFPFVAFVGMQVLPLVAILTPWLDFAAYTLPAWAGWLGAALFVAGLWLTWRGHRDLGRNWSPALKVREGHELVTSGIYGVIRHPIYAGQWLWAFGQALLVWNWIGGALAPLSFLGVYLDRVPREEQMMIDHFGAAYRAYMQRVGGIVPRLRH